MPFPDPTLAPPSAGKPSASTTMTKHELTCHSMTRRNSRSFSRQHSGRSAADGTAPTGEVRPAPASRAGNQAREPRRR